MLFQKNTFVNHLKFYFLQINLLKEQIENSNSKSSFDIYSVSLNNFFKEYCLVKFKIKLKFNI